MTAPKTLPEIRPHLLWEYDLTTFDFEASASLVIERVIKRGRMEEWDEMLRFYGVGKVLAVAKKSKQLDKRDRRFTKIFVHSELLEHAAPEA